jgi:hypothetical protein
MAKEFEVDRKKLGPAKLLDFMTSRLFESWRYGRFIWPAHR